MKTSMQMVGASLIVTASDEFTVDSDKDGTAAAKGSLAASIEVNGLEAIDELMKSADIVQKIKEKLGIGAK